MKSLDTVTTVEAGNSLRRDSIRINGAVPTTGEEARARVVIDKLREVAGEKTRVRVESRNANVKGKGLGFSASGFAALGLATSKALGLSLEPRELSEVVRLGAGSAARSLVGGFSIWYAHRKGRSFAEQPASASYIKMMTLIVSIPSTMKTDRAHADVLTSPFFKARLAYLEGVIRRMRGAIGRRNVSEICRLAEVDTLNLHAITMTGRLETSPSLRIVKEAAEGGKPVLGICNGFQILVEAGLLPGAVLRNSTLRFVCAWTRLRVETTRTPFTNRAERGQVLEIPIAHNEGRYYLDKDQVPNLERNQQIVFRYVNEEREPTDDANPNGSVDNIAGICNQTGNVMGLMPHPERASLEVLSPDNQADGRVIFDSMIRALRGTGG